MSKKLETKQTAKIAKSSHPIVNQVAIIGAGPGGLATAIALRNQGIDAHVYERAKELRPIGAGLTLAPNGLKCLDAIEPGIADRLRLSGSPLCQINAKTQTGETLRIVPVTAMEKYGQPILGISWFYLQTILASYLPSDIIHLNHRCIGFEQNHHSVTLNFDGGKTATADLLIGADGINSAVRQALVGDGPPRYRGRMSWRAAIEYSHKLLPPQQATSINPPGQSILLLDIGGGYIYWGVGVRSKGISLSENHSQLKSRVLEAVAGWPSPVPEIIAATNAEAILELPICDRRPLSSWSQGRVTLLGDAAHAMGPVLGQGANTTFEDAWELSQYLSGATSLQTALSNYERSRIERTQIAQAKSVFAGYRSYNPDLSLQDFEQEFGRMPDQARVSDDEFSEWLLSYDPDAIAEKIANSR